jgi:hypothetical protein
MRGFLSLTAALLLCACLLPSALAASFQFTLTSRSEVRPLNRGVPNPQSHLSSSLSY